MLNELVVRPADSHIGAWITEFSGRFRHKRVKGTEEASLKIGETIRMLNRIVLNHIEHINLRRENLRECNRVGRSIGSRLSKVGSKENPVERKRL